mmetsp:Transcript_23910/g.56336  ORF Transcript_23910/g.56336 Transcript_23910/m.56336 type:complete len:447 (+) Transcript_23910:423-1763(+)
MSVSILPFLHHLPECKFHLCQVFSTSPGINQYAKDIPVGTEVTFTLGRGSILQILKNLLNRIDGFVSSTPLPGQHEICVSREAGLHSVRTPLFGLPFHFPDQAFDALGSGRMSRARPRENDLVEGFCIRLQIVMRAVVPRQFHHAFQYGLRHFGTQHPILEFRPSHQGVHEIASSRHEFLVVAREGALDELVQHFLCLRDAARLGLGNDACLPAVVVWPEVGVARLGIEILELFQQGFHAFVVPVSRQSQNDAREIGSVRGDEVIAGFVQRDHFLQDVIRLFGPDCRFRIRPGVEQVLIGHPVWHDLDQTRVLHFVQQFFDPLRRVRMALALRPGFHGCRIAEGIGGRFDPSALGIQFVHHFEEPVRHFRRFDPAALCPGADHVCEKHSVRSQAGIVLVLVLVFVFVRLCLRLRLRLPQPSVEQPLREQGCLVGVAPETNAVHDHR